MKAALIDVAEAVLTVIVGGLIAFGLAVARPIPDHHRDMAVHDGPKGSEESK